MHPESSRLLHAFQVALDGEEPEQEVSLSDGSRFAVERDPSPGVVMRIRQASSSSASADAGSFSMVVFAASPRRPAGYPPGLPFVPDADVSVGVGTDGRRWANWWFAQDTDDLVDELVAQSRVDGWKEAGPPEAAARPGVRTAELHRGPHARFITAAGAGAAGFVSLAEYPREAPSR